MLRNSLRPVRYFVDAMSTKQRVWSLIIVVIYVLLVIGFVNLAVAPPELKIATVILIPILTAIFIYIFVAFHHRQEDDLEQAETDRSEAEVHIPPKPPYPPISSESDDEPNLAIVMKKILNRLDADAMKEEQKRESERKATEAKLRLLSDKTVYYDKNPGVAYYVKRGLWKTLLALGICVLLVLLSLHLANSSDEPRWFIMTVITFASFTWYSIRCYGDWKWTRRKIEGNQVKVIEPSNAFFALIGADYEVSLLDCGNIVVRKSWYERIFPFLFRSARVSIDTRLTDREEGDSSTKVTDVFKNMDNMQDPEEFRDIVQRKHDELTLGQPGNIRRSEQ